MQSEPNVIKLRKKPFFVIASEAIWSVDLYWIASGYALAMTAE
jgi:hypothetical protein